MADKRIVVIDTNVFVSALLRSGGASREVLRRCLRGDFVPLMGNALFAEYEAVLSREALFAKSLLPQMERERLFDAFLSACSWTRVYYLWRPNVRDEADNHLVELAVAGGAERLVTRNVRDLKGMELRFDRLAILRPEDIIKET